MTAGNGLIARLQQRVWLRLILLLGGTLIAVSTVLLLLVVGFYTNRLRAEQEHAASQVGSLLHAALENAMLKRDIPGLTAIVSGLGQQPSIDRVMILNPAREIRFASDPALIGQILPPDAAPARGSSRSEVAVPNREACRSCHGEVTEHPLNGTLVVDYDDHGLFRQALTGALGLVLLGGLATLAASVALAFGLRRIVVRPVAELARAADAMASGDLSARVAPSGRDEIAALGHSFNRMAGHIETSQAELIRAERMSQSLIDAIPDGIRVIGPDFRIRRANAAYAAQVGLPLDQIVGQFCHRSSHGRDTPCPWTMVTCPVAEMKQTARRLTFRDQHRRPDGSAMAVEVSAAPMDGLVVEAIRDLDEQVRVSQTERLSEIGLLATGVAHEIHNPLSSIALTLSMLNRDLAQDRTDRALQYLDLIRAEIDKSLQITDSLLRLGSPASGEPQLIDLAPAIGAVTRLLDFQAQTMQVRIEIDIPADLRVLIADSDLRMAVTNLVLNAFHAMPEGGLLTLSARRAGERVELAITDTGLGIAPENLQNIFMPFWSRRADRSSGRGLGLAITRAIAERAHASLSVQSTLGQGSRFTLSFPDPDHAHVP